MARGIVRAVAYLPRASDGRVRIGAADEDAFTCAATALERLRRLVAEPPTAAPLRVIGLPDPADRRALAAVLGAGQTVAGPAGGAPPGPEEVGLAAAGPGPQWLVVTAFTRARTTVGPTHPPGDGAAALLLDDRPGATALPSVLMVETTADPSALLAGLFDAARARADRRIWTGAWDDDPATGPPAEGFGPGGDPAPVGVSQGAFVSAARDEDGRASRWTLAADRCGTCGARTFPARGRCSGCGAEDGLARELLPLEGATVLATTWIGAGGQPTEFDPQVERSGPYGVVLAEVTPGVRVTLMLTETRRHEVRIGSKVDTVLRRLYPMEGRWRYGRKAVPAGRGSTPSPG